MTVSKVIKYLVYAIVLFGYLFLSGSIMESIKIIVSTTFRPWPYIFLFNSLMPIMFGVLLGLEQLIGQFRQDGHWCIIVEKGVFLGLPPLALYAFIVLYFEQGSRIIGIGWFTNYVTQYAMQNTWFLNLVGIVLGYTLATVFQKSQEINL